ncbi:MAG: ATP phosphoribosyltransferase regulatory subunit [Ottowia sp.]|nr:ATP phosphoribosyltransferase regulatory subunit [Ottowia sp.]
MSAWLLPDSIADVLPPEAAHIEALRRSLLDTAGRYGYELLMPPLVEHLESLLTGAGEALELQTFRLVDQLSGRMVGVRADTTPQVARVDAHVLARAGLARLCYCGPVLHAAPERPHATREPLQFGAELYGHAGREADREVLQLALECLQSAAVEDVQLDLGDVRVVRALMAGVLAPREVLLDVHRALAAKDASALRRITRDFPAASRAGLLALPNLYGDAKVLDEAAAALPDTQPVRGALEHLRWLAQHCGAARVSFDLADTRGWGYYSGMRFAIYAPGADDALLRGGRYDGVGAVFSARARAAVGFSLDIKHLARCAAPPAPSAAIRAPWGEEPALLAAIAALRAQGEVVICIPPDAAGEVDAFRFERELQQGEDGAWRVQPLDAA